MKLKYFSYLLILLFTGFSFVSLPFLKHLKKEVKKEIKIKIFAHQMKEDELFQFSENDLKEAIWIDSEEFTLHEELYDIVKTDMMNGEKIYTCFLDKKETKIARIENNLEKFFVKIRGNQNSAKSRLKNRFKFNVISSDLANCSTDLSKLPAQISRNSSFKFSVKISEFIDRMLIPPQV